MKPQISGRPKKETRKIHRHTFRLTDREELIFFKSLQIAGCTASKFIREAVMNKADLTKE
jgi:hypothetical protein